MGTATRCDITLWEGAAYFIAVAAHKGEVESGYFNIEQLTINTHIPREALSHQPT